MTHPHFKTVVPYITNVEGINNLVGTALDYQYMFHRKTTPLELKEWDYDELQKFEINLEIVDRLYYIKEDCHSNGSEFQLIVRMDYKGTHLYVELAASCDYTGFDCVGGGYIFVSRDADLFMKLVLEPQCAKNLIYKSLAEDGIHAEAEEEESYSTYARLFIKNPPSLKYLYYEALIYLKLYTYSSVL